MYWKPPGDLRVPRPEIKSMFGSNKIRPSHHFCAVQYDHCDRKCTECTASAP